jgi:hypothetical protein
MRMCLKLLIGIFTLFCMASFPVFAGVKLAWQEEPGPHPARQVAQQQPIFLTIEDQIYNSALQYLNGEIGDNLTQPERDLKAERLFLVSGTPQAFNNLGWMCIKRRAKLDLHTQEERNRAAAIYFHQAGSQKAKLNLALMYIDKMLEPNLGDSERYKTIKSLLQEANDRMTLEWYEENKLSRLQRVLVKLKIW